MAQVTAWADFLNGQLALAEIDEQMVLTVLRKAESVIFLREVPKAKTATEAKAHRDLDSEVEKWGEDYRVAKAFRKLTGVLYEKCERSAALLSRELSRRQTMEGPRRKVANLRP